MRCCCTYIPHGSCFSSTSAHLSATLSLPRTPEKKRHKIDGKKGGLEVCCKERLLIRLLSKEELFSGRRVYMGVCTYYDMWYEIVKGDLTLVSPADPTQITSTSSSIATPPMRPVLTFHLHPSNQRAMVALQLLTHSLQYFLPKYSFTIF